MPKEVEFLSKRPPALQQCPRCRDEGNSDARAGGGAEGGMKYLICKHGDKITIKRSDRNYDFGEVINERDTLEAARLCCKVERMALKHYLDKVLGADRGGERGRDDARSGKDRDAKRS